MGEKTPVVHLGDIFMSDILKNLTLRDIVRNSSLLKEKTDFFRSVSQRTQGKSLVGKRKQLVLFRVIRDSFMFVFIKLFSEPILLGSKC